MYIIEEAQFLRSIYQSNSRRIYRGAVNLILFRHCPSKIFWNVNIKYKNDWYTLPKLTKPVFAFRHCENLVSSSIYTSWVSLSCIKIKLTPWTTVPKCSCTGCEEQLELLFDNSEECFDLEWLDTDLWELLASTRSSIWDLKLLNNFNT